MQRPIGWQPAPAEAPDPEAASKEYAAVARALRESDDDFSAEEEEPRYASVSHSRMQSGCLGWCWTYCRACKPDYVHRTCRPRLTIEAAASVLLTAAGAVLAGPSQRVAEHAAVPAGVRNRTLDWSAGSSAPALGSSPDPYPSPGGGSAVNGACDAAAGAPPKLVLPVQVSLDSDPTIECFSLASLGHQNGGATNYQQQVMMTKLVHAGRWSVRARYPRLPR